LENQGKSGKYGKIGEKRGNIVKKAGLLGFC
jgi:hypothetical protein